MLKTLRPFMWLFLVLVVLVGSASIAKSQRTIVAFTAQWCASCREVLPVVRQMANEFQYPVMVEVDVDQRQSLKQAEMYGIAIPSSELPQVYLVDDGQVRLIFDGSQYTYGQIDELTASLRQTFRRHQQ